MSDVPVKNLLETLVFPSEGATIRYNDGASSTPSAARVLSQELNLNWATATVDRNIPATEQMVFLFRDPLRATIFYDHNPSRSNFTYQLYDADFNDTTFYTSGASTILNFAWGTCTTAYQPHGPRLFPLRQNGQTGIWCDNDGTNFSTLQFTVDDATAIAGDSFNCYYWTGNSWLVSQMFYGINGAATYTMTGLTNIPVGGAYFSVVFNKAKTSSVSSMTVSLVCGSGTGPSVWCHRPISNIIELLPIVESVRVVAASLRWINDSPQLDESGKIVSVCVAPTHPWSQVAVSQSNLTQINGYKTRQAKMGLHTYLKPAAQDDSFTYNGKGIVKNTAPGSSIVSTSFKSTGNSPYVVASMNVANTNARDTSVTVTHAIEFITDSKIQECRMPDASVETWNKALALLAPLPQHNDADIDLRDLLNGGGSKRAKTQAV